MATTIIILSITLGTFLLVILSILGLKKYNRYKSLIEKIAETEIKVNEFKLSLMGRLQDSRFIQSIKSPALIDRLHNIKHVLEVDLKAKKNELHLDNLTSALNDAKSFYTEWNQVKDLYNKALALKQNIEHFLSDDYKIEINESILKEDLRKIYSSIELDSLDITDYDEFKSKLVDEFNYAQNCLKSWERKHDINEELIKLKKDIYQKLKSIPNTKANKGLKDEVKNLRTSLDSSINGKSVLDADHYFNSLKDYVGYIQDKLKEINEKIAV